VTILDQLRTLSRQFPNSLELAVTPEQLYEYEQEMVRTVRHIPGATRLSRHPVEHLPGGIAVQQTNVRFKSHTLTKVFRASRRRQPLPRV